VTSLHSFETLAVGHHLLCLSPLSTSISVHTACLSETDEKSIHVTEELNKADAVYTGAAALRQCARLWQWNEDRIPYTFPISKESKSTLWNEYLSKLAWNSIDIAIWHGAAIPCLQGKSRRDQAREYGIINSDARGSRSMSLVLSPLWMLSMSIGSFRMKQPPICS
jgi:hypothetical protein